MYLIFKAKVMKLKTISVLEFVAPDLYNWPDFLTDISLIPCNKAKIFFNLGVLSPLLGFNALGVRNISASLNVHVA